MNLFSNTVSLTTLLPFTVVRKAINGDWTHVLWLDSDMVFSENIVDDLQFCGQDFGTGIAHGRRKPFMSCLFKNIDLDHLERWKRRQYND